MGLQYTLPHKIEHCLVTLLTGSLSGSGVNVYYGEDNETNRKPCVICHAKDTDDEVALFTGCWHIETEINVKQNAKSVDRNHISELADSIFNTVLDPSVNLGSYLTNTSGSLNVYEIFVKGQPDIRKEGDILVSTLRLSIVANG